MIRSLIIGTLLLASSSLFAAVSINGSGSTFAEPVYTRWFADYQKTHTSAQFNYQGVGSGAGIKQLIEGTVDFAGSDDPMKAEDAAKAKESVLHIPVAMGAVVVSYNAPITGTLKLSGAVIAKIFNGGITKWNDAEIAKLNPKMTLPTLPIVVATRSDGSGTTAVFTEYLSKVSPEWAGKNGKTVKWFSGSLGAKGNAGVAGLIKQNPGTIGYVELVYAKENNLPFAQVQNKKGEFIEASSASVSTAAEGIKKAAVDSNFKISITDSDHKGAYPISSFTWMLVFEKMPKEKGTEIVNFAKWALSDEAQKTAGSINFSPVPKEIRAEVLKAVAKIQLQ
ncbi:MAG: phosphate ABC transporter substrate-binding protein PstS [Pseudobdellovibrio sp.]